MTRVRVRGLDECVFVVVAVPEANRLTTLNCKTSRDDRSLADLPLTSVLEARGYIQMMARIKMSAFAPASSPMLLSLGMMESSS